MKKTNKFLSVILAILMVVSIIPITASAVTPTSGTCGENLTWTFDSSTGVLTISGEGDMYDYTSSNRPWQDYVKKIDKIVIDDGVTSIGDYAFYNCHSTFSFLFSTNTSIPDSVTKIGAHAFDSCSLITTFDAPNVTSIGAYAFANCDNLKSAVIPDAITVIEERTFYSCSDLEYIVLGKGIEEVKSSTFTGCVYLEAIFYTGTTAEYEKIDWYEIEDEYEYEDVWQYMSIFCEYKNESISGKCGENLTWTYHVPTNSLTISGTGEMYNSVRTNPIWGYYFKERVTSIVIEEGVTSVGEYAFENFQRLYNVSFPESLTSIGYSAFYYCKYIDEIIIPDNVTAIGNAAFYECSGIDVVTIGDGLTTIGNSTFANNTSLNSLTIGKGVTQISDSAFGGCSNLSTIIVDEENQYLANDEYGALFNKNKTKLIWFPRRKIVEHYEIPDTVNVISGNAFDNCQYLGGVTIPDSVNTIGIYAFRNCKKITSIVIPDSVTSMGYGVFYWCNYLESVTLPSSIKTIPDEAFYKCASIKEITIPDSVTKIGNWAFVSCKKLTNITIPDNVTEIGQEAFQDCYNLENIKFGNGLIRIGARAFEDCSSLKTIILPDGFRSDNQETFSYCRNLKAIYIPDSTTYLGYNSFYGCSNLKNVYYAGTESEWQNVNCSSLKEKKNVTFHFNAFVSDTEVFAVPENENVIPEGAKFSATFIESTKHSLKVDIAFSNNQENIQPNGNVTIRIPVPADMDTNGLSVYREEENGSYTNLNAIYEDGYMVFTTNHFSIYVLSYDKPVCLHKTTIITNTIDPTCTTSGYKGDIVCEVCGNTLESLGETPASGHKYKSTVTAPTCTERGYTTYTCECEDSYVGDYVNATGHTEEMISAVAPSCTETGLTEGTECSVCGETLTEQKELPANGHSPANAVEENYIAPTCTGNGSKDVVVYCSVCEDEISRETVVLESTGHADNDGDGYCDDDNELLDPSVECDHACHKDGISGFIWRITNFFNKLFGINKVCECGEAHY